MRKHCSKSGMSAFLGKVFPWCEIAESPLAAVGSGMGVRQLRNNLDQLKFVSTSFGNNWVKVMNDCREGQPMVPWPWAAPTWQKVNGDLSVRSGTRNMWEVLDTAQISQCGPPCLPCTHQAQVETQLWGDAFSAIRQSCGGESI